MRTTIDERSAVGKEKTAAERCKEADVSVDTLSQTVDLKLNR